MKNSVAKVVILTLVTFGIYGIVWFVGTKDEMNKRGANIPTGWLLIVPIANLIWMWKWAGGVEKVTSGKQSQAIAFILVFLLSVIGMAIVQSEFNKLEA
jgi:cytochrome bd-type quinol oxidase subunit 2